jgi:hypothetical protein
MAPNIGLGNSTTPDRGHKLFTAATVMVIIAGLITIARVAVRLSIKQLGIGDYTIMASLVSARPYSRIAAGQIDHADSFRRSRCA